MAIIAFNTLVIVTVALLAALVTPLPGALIGLLAISAWLGWNGRNDIKDWLRRK